MLKLSAVGEGWPWFNLMCQILLTSPRRPYPFGGVNGDGLWGEGGGGRKSEEGAEDGIKMIFLKNKIKERKK